MNKNIFRSRTVIGAVCILLAVLVCFGITPLFNEGLKAQTEAVRVKAEVIPRGTYITADMVEVYTRGASGMEDSIATSLDEVVGRYTYVELRKNTDVNTAWLSSEPLTQYEYLTRLNGSKVAISVTIPTFAKGGSGKVEAGDIIMLFATNKDTGDPVVVGYIALGSVENLNGVLHTEGPYYTAGNAAGDIRVGTPGNSVTGNLRNDKITDGHNVVDPDSALAEGSGATLMTGFLEASGTDLAAEFANMIIYQRGYQANTRIVTVTDTMLEELVNMKR